MPRKIFISAVSGELKSYRLVVDRALRIRGYEPVFQELFGLGDEKIVELLRGKVAECDAVICLIGRRYGAEPSVALPEFGRRSFTQLEYFLAKASVPPKPCYRFCTTDGTPVDTPNNESDELRGLQKAYRDEVTRDRDWRKFENADQLRAEIAELRFPWEAPAAGHRPCNLPTSIGALFQGRDEFLRTLTERLAAAVGKAAAITPRQAIHGLGGIGKTQLAVEYGWRNSERFNALLYVFGNTAETLLTNLAQLSGVLELPERELQDDNERKQAVVRWLVDHPGWYLLVDNVDTDEGATAVTQLLDELHGGQIVITTRLANWSNLVEPLELDVLAYEDAAKLLLNSSPQRAKQADDGTQALALAKELDGLALAVTQAAGYVNQYRITLAAYSDRLRAETAKVLEWYDPKRMKYPCSLAVTWNTTFDRLTKAGRTLLEMLSWLSTEAISRDLLTDSEVAEAWKKAGIERPEETLVDLADVSLLHLEGESFRVHRLVQEITRGRCDDRKDWASLVAMLDVVDAYPLGDPMDVRNWHHWEPLVAHITTVCDRGDAHSIGTLTSRLMYEAALYLKERIRFPEAERHMRRALAIDERSLGPDHQEVATGLISLAYLLQTTNRFAEAEPLARRALEIYERSFETDHPEVVSALNNLAQLLKDTNRLAEAEPLMRQALAICERSFGPDHPRVATQLNNLASLLKVTNRLSEAELHLRRALAIVEQSFGPDQPKATVLSNLGLLLQATNRLAEAEPLMRRSLEISERNYGPDHPEVAIALNNLAQLLQDTNRLAEAESLMRRALAIDQQSFGSDHLIVAVRLNNLALLLHATNRSIEAESLMAHTVEIALKFQAATGHEHTHGRTTIQNYIRLLKALGRTREETAAVLLVLSERYGIPIKL